jgi:hypothetical protein
LFTHRLAQGTNSIPAKHKLHAYVEINVQKSKSRKGVASPLQALRLRPPRRVLGHLWAKGTQVQELRQEIGLEPSKFNKLVVSIKYFVIVACFRIALAILSTVSET